MRERQTWILARLGRLALLAILAALICPVAAQAAPPANDNFPGTTLSGLPANTTGTNVDATLEPGEPTVLSEVGGSTVWWSWTAPSTGWVSVETCGSNFPTTLSVYTGSSVSGLTQIGHSYQGCGGGYYGSLVGFTAQAGTTYRIQVDGYFQDHGTVSLHVIPPPANDDFPGVTVSSALPASATGNNTGATKESGEPDHAGSPGGHSIWWNWTAPSSGPVSVDTCASTFINTLLGVYTGSSVTTLTPVASNDDACGIDGFESQVTFTAQAGVAYRIAVDGFDTGQGSVVLNIRSNEPAPVPPPGFSGGGGLPSASCNLKVRQKVRRASGRKTRLKATVRSVLGSADCQSGVPFVRQWGKKCVPLKARSCALPASPQTSSTTCTISFPAKSPGHRLRGLDSIRCFNGSLSVRFEAPAKQVPFSIGFKKRDQSPS